MLSLYIYSGTFPFSLTSGTYSNSIIHHNHSYGELTSSTEEIEATPQLLNADKLSISICRITLILDNPCYISMKQRMNR